MTNIGTKIRTRREELGITQNELAVTMGYKNKSTIAKIESGTNDIPQSKIKGFADALDTSVAYLMGWDETPVVKDNRIQIVRTTKTNSPRVLASNRHSNVVKTGLYTNPITNYAEKLALLPPDDRKEIETLIDMKLKRKGKRKFGKK